MVTRPWRLASLAAHAWLLLPLAVTANEPAARRLSGEGGILQMRGPPTATPNASAARFEQTGYESAPPVWQDLVRFCARDDVASDYEQLLVLVVSTATQPRSIAGGKSWTNPDGVLIEYGNVSHTCDEVSGFHQEQPRRQRLPLSTVGPIHVDVGSRDREEVSWESTGLPSLSTIGTFLLVLLIAARLFPSVSESGPLRPLFNGLTKVLFPQLATSPKQDTVVSSKTDVPQQRPATVAPKQIPAKPSPPKEPTAHETTAQNITNQAQQDTSVVAKKDASPRDWKTMTDDEVVEHGANGGLPLYALEKSLGDYDRAVRIRRRFVAANRDTQHITKGLIESGLPYENYDYARVHGACCENVIGYLPLPLGVAGPLSVDGTKFYIPMATTEGVLVASTNRGSVAINASGGVKTVLLADGMTRGPNIRFPSLDRAAAAKLWLDSPEGFKVVEEAFNATTRYGKLQSIKVALAASDIYARFKATTGDAMGMNMISKGVDAALDAMRLNGFADMRIVSLSGNYCTDKKSAAINWIDGRGKSVSAQATVKAEVVKRTLKTDVDTLVDLGSSKNLVGSALAGALGGFNAHAANIVSAVFLATGQDPAQNVESSSCLTTMSKTAEGDLEISVSMPSVEVGTVGGGTILEPQAAMLDLLGLRGADREEPGAHAQRLARIVAAAVLAGELSLCSALAAGSLVSNHMAFNRSKA